MHLTPCACNGAAEIPAHFDCFPFQQAQHDHHTLLISSRPHESTHIGPAGWSGSVSSRRRRTPPQLGNTARRSLAELGLKAHVPSRASCAWKWFRCFRWSDYVTNRWRHPANLHLCRRCRPPVLPLPIVGFETETPYGCSRVRGPAHVTFGATTLCTRRREKKVPRKQQHFQVIGIGADECGGPILGDRASGGGGAGSGVSGRIRCRSLNSRRCASVAISTSLPPPLFLSSCQQLIASGLKRSQGSIP